MQKIINEIYKETSNILKRSGINTAKLDARLLMEHVFNITREDFIINSSKILPKSKLSKLNECIKRRLKGEPVSRIIGKREFYSLEFSISKETLDPRPDTETLIDTCLKYINDKQIKYKILDIGTGSGCILLSLLKELKNSFGIGIDISQDAIKTAKNNAKNLKLEKRSNFINLDWNNDITNKLGNFDIILSNPPYIPSNDIDKLAIEVKKYDPITALDGGNTGLKCYETIIPITYNMLKNDGFLALEIGYNQADSVSNILKKYNFNILSVEKDLAGHNRCIIATKNS